MHRLSGGLHLCERGDNHAAVLCRGYVGRAGIDRVFDVFTWDVRGVGGVSDLHTLYGGLQVRIAGHGDAGDLRRGVGGSRGKFDVYGLFGRDVCGYRGKCVVLAVSGWLQVRIECGKNYAIGVSRWIVRGGRIDILHTV